jgi:hypothetical protein
MRGSQPSLPQPHTFMPVDNVVKNADNHELAHNPIYRNLQKKLDEVTAERDVLRYAHKKLLTIVGVPHARC